MMDNKKITRILLIKLRAIGDVVMSTVVIENLARAFPNARIDFLTEHFCREAVSEHPQLHDVITIDKKKIALLSWFGKLNYQNRFFSSLRKKRYDLVLDYFGNPRSAILTFLSGAKYRVGYDYRIRKFAYNVVVPSRAKELHEVEWHLDALHMLDIPVVSHRPVFPLNAQARTFAEIFWQDHRLDEMYPVIGLNFSGGWPAKRWPLERFAALGDRLHEMWNAAIVLIWGPGEKSLAEKCQSLMKAPVLLLPETNLKQLAAFLQRMTMVISTDSGPMHISAALDTPTVGLFGPTQPEHQGPFGEKHLVVRYESLACLGCNRLECPHTSCMNWLTVDQVVKGAIECARKNELRL